MTALLRLQPRLQTLAFTSRRRAALDATLCRYYAQDSSETKDDDATPQRSRTVEHQSANYPIPSNKAQPALRDGRQSPMADVEGKLRDDLPEDVKRHNTELEQRYDRPYNHIADEGNVKAVWEKK